MLYFSDILIFSVFHFGRFYFDVFHLDSFSRTFISTTLPRASYRVIIAPRYMCFFFINVNLRKVLRCILILYLVYINSSSLSKDEFRAIRFTISVIKVQPFILFIKLWIVAVVLAYNTNMLYSFVPCKNYTDC